MDLSSTATTAFTAVEQHDMKRPNNRENKGRMPVEGGEDEILQRRDERREDRENRENIEEKREEKEMIPCAVYCLQHCILAHHSVRISIRYVDNTMTLYCLRRPSRHLPDYT
jgi:hypothetical protein